MAWIDPTSFSVGEIVTAAKMNIIKDDLLAMGPHLIAKKPSDQSITSSVTFTDDTALALPVGANEIWYTQWIIGWTDASSAVANWKGRFTFPTGTGVACGLQSTGTAVGGALTRSQLYDTTSPGTSFTRVGTIPAIIQTIVIDGYHVAGATAGNLTLQWAQNTSNASAVTVKAGSALYAIKVN